MRILFLSPAAQGGGAEAALLDLMQGLRQDQPEWPIRLISGELGPLVDKARYANVDCEVLPFPPAIRQFGDSRRLTTSSTENKSVWARLRSAFARAAHLAWALFQTAHYTWLLRSRVAAFRPDIVHSNGMKMHLLSALSRIGGKQAGQLVWHLHDYLGNRKAMAPILRRLASRCNVVVANSDSVAADAMTILPRNLKVSTVYNSVDSSRFSPAGPKLDLDQLAGLPAISSDGAVRIGLVATFGIWKGHEVFIRAMGRIRNSFPDLPIRFYIVGGPVYATPGSQFTLSSLKERALEAGIADVLGFTGFVDDVPAAMRSLDVVVHASTEPEPFGLVIIQAMSCGRPVVVSAGGGARELITSEVDALTHLPGNVEQLSDAVARLIQNPSLRADLGRQGISTVSKRFTRNRMVAAMVAVYSHLVN